MSAETAIAVLIALGFAVLALILAGFLLGAVNERDRLREDLAVQRPNRARAERALRRLVAFWEPHWDEFLRGKGDPAGDSLYSADIYDVLAESFVDIYVEEGRR